MSTISILDPEGFVYNILDGSCVAYSGCSGLCGNNRRALVPTQTAFRVCGRHLESPVRHRLAPIAFLPTHWTVHDLPLPGSTAVTPRGFWFAAFCVACLCVARHQQYSPCVSHALNPVSIFDSPFPYSSSPTFDEFGHGVFEGLQWRRPDRLRRTGGLVHVTQLSSDPCRPFGLGHCCA